MYSTRLSTSETQADVFNWAASDMHQIASVSDVAHDDGQLSAEEPGILACYLL
jgi:hypothetical protein